MTAREDHCSGCLNLQAPHTKQISDQARTTPWLGRFTAVALILTGLAMPATTYAQTPPYGPVSPYGAAGTDASLRQLIAAREELHAADAVVKALVEKYQRKLDGEDPEWGRYRKEVEEAHRARDQVHNAVLALLESDTEYGAAQRALAKAEAAVRQLAGTHAEGSREFEKADDQAYAIRNTLRELERRALEQSADLRTAEARASNADHRVQQYWEQYVSDVLERNPTWAQAVRRQQDAAVAAKQAEAAFAASHRLVSTNQVQRGHGTGSSYGSRYGSRGSSRSSGSSRSNRSRY